MTAAVNASSVVLISVRAKNGITLPWSSPPIHVGERHEATGDVCKGNLNTMCILSLRTIIRINLFSHWLFPVGVRPLGAIYNEG